MSVIAVLIGFAVVALVTGAILFAISGSLVESEDEIAEMLEERGRRRAREREGV